MADYTLFDLVTDYLTRMDALKTELATGGSTLTAEVTGLEGRGTAPGTLFVKKTTDGAAPQGEWSIISAYDEGVFTIGAVTAAIGAGDIIQWSGNAYRLYELLADINAMWSRIGDVVYHDTSLTTASAQTEYTIPQEIKRGVTTVELQRNTDDSDDNAYEPVYNWEIIHSTPGVDGTLRFFSQPATGKTIRITYVDIHPEIWLATDVISEDLPREPLINVLMALVLEGKYTASPGGGRKEAAKAKTATERAESLIRRFPKNKPPVRSTTRYSRGVARRSRSRFE